MLFGDYLKHRRNELKLGLRETCRLTDNIYVPSPIKSPIYLSRLENGIEKEMPAASASIDKLWGLGIALRVSPLILFLMSRGKNDLLNQITGFHITTTKKQGFGEFLRSRRKHLALSMREAVSREELTWDISVAYWSQMETNFKDCAANISGEKLWSIGVILGVDPLLLYVLSRKVSPRFLDLESRRLLFI